MGKRKDEMKIELWEKANFELKELCYHQNQPRGMHDMIV